MDMALEGAGTRRGDDEETYEDEDHVYSFMYSCQIELESTTVPFMIEVVVLVSCRENT